MNLDAGVVAGVFILCGGKASRRGREQCTLILLLGEYLTELRPYLPVREPVLASVVTEAEI